MSLCISLYQYIVAALVVILIKMLDLVTILSILLLLWHFMFRLPMPRPGEVLGLVGTNGIGKSTALKILAGKQKPNLGKFTVSPSTKLSKQINIHVYFILQNPPDWHEILTYFRGSELQNYFTKLLEDDLKACIKPQYVDQIPRAVKGTVQDMLDKKDELKVQDAIVDQFGKNIL